VPHQRQRREPRGLRAQHQLPQRRHQHVVLHEEGPPARPSSPSSATGASTSGTSARPHWRAASFAMRVQLAFESKDEGLRLLLQRVAPPRPTHPDERDEGSQGGRDGSALAAAERRTATAQRTPDAEHGDRLIDDARVDVVPRRAQKSAPHFEWIRGAERGADKRVRSEEAQAITKFVREQVPRGRSVL
jgi:hypothetical protein